MIVNDMANKCTLVCIHSKKTIQVLLSVHGTGKHMREKMHEEPRTKKSAAWKQRTCEPLSDSTGETSVAGVVCFFRREAHASSLGSAASFRIQSLSSSCIRDCLSCMRPHKARLTRDRSITT